MNVAFLPEYAWQTWAAVTVVLVVALAIVATRRLIATGFVTPSEISGSPRIRKAIGALSAGAALLLAAALCGVVGLDERPASAFHVAVPLDVSDSVLRATGGWPAVRAEIAKRLDDAFGDRHPTITAQLLPFRSEAAAFGGVVPLARIGDEVRRLDMSSFGAGTGTNIGAALLRAAAEIDRAGGRGAVLLISDGHETEGDAAAAARQLARRGVVIYTLSMAGGPPEVGIVAANLSLHVRAGATTFARGAVKNSSDSERSAELTVVRNALPVDRSPGVSFSEARRTAMTFDGQQSARLRVPLVFPMPGMQFLDIVLRSNGSTHRSRLFTHVERPPRVLAIGHATWTPTFAQGSLLVTHKAPSELTSTDAFEEFDAIVIDSVPAGAFAEGVLAKVASAVAKGAGLFVMNGRHLGTAADRTNLMTYAKTPLEPLLPLVAGPRPDASQPSRHVVIVIDSSGSMEGPRLAQAKQIAEYIVRTFLRPKDVLDLFAFTTGAASLVKAEPMTPEGQEKAIAEIRHIGAGGGTDPTAVIRELNKRSLTNCALLFFSDGEFGSINEQRPDCRTTAFAIQSGTFGLSSAIRALAEPVMIEANFDPTRLTIPSFEPRKDQFYEDGLYPPRSMRYVLPRMGALEVPDLPLEGSATTFAKPDSDLAVIRPKVTDPVLAYGYVGLATVGEFTTAIPEQWLLSEEGRRAIRQWIAATFPLADEQRYLFRVSQDGPDLELEVALSPRAGRLPVVESIDARVVSDSAAEISIPFRRDDSQPSTFRSRFTLPVGEAPIPATLVLQESGRDALSGPQRIGILLPPRAEAGMKRGPEAFSTGTNSELLRQLATMGRGTHNEPHRLIDSAAPAREQSWPIWPLLAVAACVCHLVAVFLRRIDA